MAGGSINLTQEGRIVVMEDSMNSGVRFAQLRRKFGDFAHLRVCVFDSKKHNESRLRARQFTTAALVRLVVVGFAIFDQSQYRHRL